MKSGCNILLKLLGLLLLTGASLKAHQLLTQPLANTDIWSSRPFLIFVVECELALGIWLFSGLFRKAAWLTAFLCFLLFSCITLYKGITGAASCGCFGTVHVNPWITLACIDLPAVILLSIFRPKLDKENAIHIAHWLQPLPKAWTCCVVFALSLCTVSASTIVLTLNKPALITTKYEVLEPDDWHGKELPILGHIDIAEQLKTGIWTILLYHHDCPNCQQILPDFIKMPENKKGFAGSTNTAIIEVPPYQKKRPTIETSCRYGRMDNVKRWLIPPSLLTVKDGIVKSVWTDESADLKAICQSLL